MLKLAFIFLLTTLLISCGSSRERREVKNYAESEYRLRNGIPQESIRFSPVRYAGERGKIFIIVQVLPTEVMARPVFNQYQLYNQTLRGILQSECARHFKNINASLGFLEYLEIKTQRYTNFSYRTWGKAVCHGSMKDQNFNL